MYPASRGNHRSSTSDLGLEHAHALDKKSLENERHFIAGVLAGDLEAEDLPEYEIDTDSKIAIAIIAGWNIDDYIADDTDYAFVVKRLLDFEHPEGVSKLMHRLGDIPQDLRIKLIDMYQEDTFFEDILDHLSTLAAEDKQAIVEHMIESGEMGALHVARHSKIDNVDYNRVASLILKYDTVSSVFDDLMQEHSDLVDHDVLFRSYVDLYSFVNLLDYDGEIRFFDNLNLDNFRYLLSLFDGDSQRYMNLLMNISRFKYRDMSGEDCSRLVLGCFSNPEDPDHVYDRLFNKDHDIELLNDLSEEVARKMIEDGYGEQARKQALSFSPDIDWEKLLKDNNE